MYNNDYMYGVERSNEYLAHYGIRGMKWGVRKAIKSGNSARLSKQYAKASKKLAKLEKRAGKTGKYARRAALMGAGAAAAGGLAVAGTEGVASGMRRLVRPAAAASRDVGRLLTKVPGRNKVSQALHNTGVNMYVAGKTGKVGGAMTRAATAVDQWGKAKTVGTGIQNAAGKIAGRTIKGKNAVFNTVSSNVARNATKGVAGLSNNTIARIGAGAVGAGLAVGAAKNAYRAATAKKKAAKFKSEMNKAFAGTQYANGGQPRQGKKRRR